jgi:endonuclease-3
MPNLLSKKAVSEIFSRFSAATPHPKTELFFTNNYTLLVAVVLSAQATDKGVNKATKPLFAKISTAAEMLAFGEENLLEAIKTIGLFRGKAKNIIALSRILIEQNNGEVPKDLKALQSLPGVGEKTARVVLNCAFGEATIAVDTHIQRISNRIGLVKTRNATETMRVLPDVIPPEFMLHAHHWLILHGRYICLARRPRCQICTIKDLCNFPEKILD